MGDLLPLYIVLIVVIIVLKIVFWTWRITTWRKARILRAQSVVIVQAPVNQPYGRFPAHQPYVMPATGQHPPPHAGYPAPSCPPPPYSGHGDVHRVNPDPEAGIKHEMGALHANAHTLSRHQNW